MTLASGSLALATGIAPFSPSPQEHFARGPVDDEMLVARAAEPKRSSTFVHSRAPVPSSIWMCTLPLSTGAFSSLNCWLRAPVEPPRISRSTVCACTAGTVFVRTASSSGRSLVLRTRQAGAQPEQRRPRSARHRIETVVSRRGTRARA